MPTDCGNLSSKSELGCGRANDMGGPPRVGSQSNGQGRTPLVPGPPSRAQGRVATTATVRANASSRTAPGQSRPNILDARCRQRYPEKAAPRQATAATGTATRADKGTARA